MEKRRIYRQKVAKKFFYNILPELYWRGNDRQQRQYEWEEQEKLRN